MQDLSTGKFVPLDPKFLEGIAGDSRELRDRLQRACDAAEPDRSKHGPVFIVGEEIEIRGGRFQVTKIEPGRLVLSGLPAKPR
jgi:hypothetical protein